tara:strand:- start:4133 stop:4438 length:306 start_codon:yes stop_codon:yes gene_type:complete
MSADIKTQKIRIKDLTEEEKKDRKRTLHREYMARRRAEDPEFLLKQREYCKAYSKTEKNREKQREKEKGRSEYKHYWYLQKKSKIQELESKIVELQAKITE